MKQWIIMIVALLGSWCGSALAQSSYGSGVMHGPGPGMMTGMMIIPIVISLLIIVILVLLILALIKYLRQ